MNLKFEITNMKIHCIVILLSLTSIFRRYSGHNNEVSKKVPFSSCFYEKLIREHLEFRNLR